MDRTPAPMPKALPLAKPIAPSAEQPIEIVNQATVRTGKPSAIANAAARQKRKKQKMIRGIATIVGLATIVGILAGLLVMRLQQQANRKKGESETIAAATNQNTEAIEQNDTNPDTLGKSPTTSQRDPEQEPPEKQEAASKQVPAKQEKQIRHEELPPQELFFHDAKKVAECWDLIHPHLVKLTVHDARGTHEAIGTIVDSRGWILTSYSAIKGALKIDVSSGYEKIDQYYLPPNLTDSVRGIITSDPAQDLAVLSINRRFIVSFANIAITDKDFVIEGDFMIQCSPPTPKNVYSCNESKIAISGKFDDLSTASKSVAKSKDLVSNTLPWIVCPDQREPLPGEPLARIDGTLEAIHVFNVENNAHYVSVHNLKTLLADAKDDPQPLRSMQQSGGVAGESDQVAVGVDHPIRQTSVEMNRLATACQKFNWIATDKTEYENLQTFAEQFATAIKFIKANQKTDPDLTTEIQAQVKQIKTSIAAGVNKPDKASVELMNQLAATDLKKAGRIVPFYGHVTELEVSVRHDVLELSRTEPAISVCLNPDESRDPFYRGDVCLAFIEVPTQPERKGFVINKQKVVAVLVDLITRIDVAR